MHTPLLRVPRGPAGLRWQRIRPPLELQGCGSHLPSHRSGSPPLPLRPPDPCPHSPGHHGGVPPTPTPTPRAPSPSLAPSDPSSKEPAQWPQPAQLARLLGLPPPWGRSDGSQGPVPPGLDSSLPQTPSSRRTGLLSAPGRSLQHRSLTLTSQEGGFWGSPSRGQGPHQGPLFFHGSCLRACEVSSSLHCQAQSLPGGWGGGGLPSRRLRPTEVCCSVAASE